MEELNLNKIFKFIISSYCYLFSLIYILSKNSHFNEVYGIYFTILFILLLIYMLIFEFKYFFKFPTSIYNKYNTEIGIVFFGIVNNVIFYLTLLPHDIESYNHLKEFIKEFENETIIIKIAGILTFYFIYLSSIYLFYRVLVFFTKKIRSLNNILKK